MLFRYMKIDKINNLKIFIHMVYSNINNQHILLLMKKLLGHKHYQWQMMK